VLRTTERPDPETCSSTGSSLIVAAFLVRLAGGLGSALGSFALRTRFLTGEPSALVAATLAALRARFLGATSTSGDETASVVG